MPKLDKVQFKRSNVANKKPTSEQLMYGEIAINYAKDSEAIFFKNMENNIIEITPTKKTFNITWADLKKLRDDGSLAEGALYRITDYVTETRALDTRSTKHPFDIIVTAESKTKLNENALACQHEGDTYFANSNLSAWKLKYCLDNDTTRFSVAHTTAGKGVIWWMKDEQNNECYYDFKNIQFKRCKVRSTLNFASSLVSTCPYLGTNGDNSKGLSKGTDNDYIWCYTFSKYTKDSSLMEDASLTVSGNLLQCHDNCIEPLYASVKMDDGSWRLKVVPNNGVIYVNNFDSNPNDCLCYNNHISPNCHSFTAMAIRNAKCGYGCYKWNCGVKSYGWSCGASCYSWTCGGNNQNWHCGSGCFSWGIGVEGSRWSCGNGCWDWQCGNYCTMWSCGEECYQWKCGTACKNWHCGNNCRAWTCGDGCETWRVGDSCFGWTAAANCDHWSCGDVCYGWKCGQNCDYWHCGDNCYSWTAGEASSNWVCGDNCDGWVCGDNCNGWRCHGYNKQWECSANTTYFTLSRFVSYIIIASTKTPTYNAPLKNFTIGQNMSGMGGTEKATITIDNSKFPLGSNYEWTVARNSSGAIKQYCISDLIN